MDLGYVELFHRLDEDAIDSVWSEPGAPDTLESLATDPRFPELARFLAAEILFHKRPGYPPQDARSKLAPVYAAALAQGFTRITNSWGMPGYLDGPAGQHFVALGEAAVPELTRLLSDGRRTSFSGSREAVSGNRYRYRVKDFAAHFIAEIRHIPFEIHEDPETRNESIQQLKDSLE
jgi:hypothetical protein